MLKTQDLKKQIDELTKQNEMLMNALQSANKILENEQTGQGNQMGQGNQQGIGQNLQINNLANELLKIKDLAAKLETKAASYVSNQTGGALTEKDVVYLVVTLIDGMVDWANEFIKSKSSASASSPQSQ